MRKTDEVQSSKENKTFTNGEKMPTRENPQSEFTIMVVDDTPTNLTLLNDILKKIGYRVLAFPRGDLAIKAAIKSPPDLILLDIMMPDLNGFEVCKRLKSYEHLKEIPIIFISALDDLENKIKAFSVGGVDYVTKPFQFEEVHARVKTHLKLNQQKKRLKENYERLKELEALRDSLVHMIVHDLRSPLMSITGYLDLALMEELPEKAKAYLTNVKSSSQMLIELINTLLDVNKIESGNMSLEYSPVEINSLVTRTMNNLSALKGTRSLKFISENKEIIVNCDRQLIERVIWNLVGNAIKFTPERNGQIIVSTVASGNLVKIGVSDNGHGIPREYQEVIFEKFAQAHCRESGIRTSTGLGLTFCKLVAEAHGGKIYVESEQNKGTTFWVELPLDPPRAGATTRRHQPEVSS